MTRDEFLQTFRVSHGLGTQAEAAKAHIISEFDIMRAELDAANAINAERGKVIAEQAEMIAVLKDLLDN